MRTGLLGRSRRKDRVESDRKREVRRIVQAKCVLEERGRG